ncbi:MAG: PRC-barrel domain-containing protein, partial [Actinomycetota bacterium]
MEDQARRVSYQALPKGVPVRSSGGEEIGTVEHVLEVPELDVFDGIVLKTEAGLRFADANQVA